MRGAILSMVFMAVMVRFVSGQVLLGEGDLPTPPSNIVQESSLGEFSSEDYIKAVEALIDRFESENGKKLEPGEKGKVGLKVYTVSGPGLSTPENLVRGLIIALEKRGFVRDDIFIIGLSEHHLRLGGFMPPLSIGGDSFEEVEVKALNSGLFYDDEWFYDSPIPRDVSLIDYFASKEDDLFASNKNDRRSFLAKPLLFEVDFWINLPAYSDHPVLGINGSLVNATLWNASNTVRFFRSPATAPVAVAEISAIPEFRAGWIFTIVSLERYQYIGGPVFNSLYTVSESRLWLSDNPVILDALMRVRIDKSRREAGFRGLAEDMKLLEYAEQLGLGEADHERVEWSKVD
ncbi:MAG: DUF362 domain-containing protein [Opitutaceae bacterium]|nr:DUF362 domain-containing protein [Opitutaceae bacterium]